MFTLEVEKLMPTGWDAYSSGGGCYHAMKEFKTITGNVVAVEVHWSGGAQMYKANEGDKLVASKELEDENCWCNYIELAWINERVDNENAIIMQYDDITFTDYIGVFPHYSQAEIIEAMKIFTKAYDKYMY